MSETDTPRTFISNEAAKIRPTKGNVFVKGIRPSETKGGIAIPDNYQDDNPRAMVVATHRDNEGDYKDGDIVHIVSGIGLVNLKFDGEDYYVVSEEGILAWVEE